MPRKRKRSVSPSKGITGGGGSLGVSDREGLNSIQQGMGSTSQSVRSNIRHHSNEPEAVVSPRHRHPPPLTAHSPSSHYQPLYEQQQHPNQPYSPPNSNTYHSQPHPLYHHPNSSHPYHNSPDHEVQPHASSYPMHDQSSNPPPNPHAPSHYNFANRAYAQQRDSGFNTFRVNPGPAPGPIPVNPSPIPPPSNSVAPPLHSPSIAAPPPPSGFQHHQYPEDDSHHFHHRSYSHSHSQPTASASSSVPASHVRLSPPMVVSRDPVTRNELESGNRNGARRSRRARIRNGNDSPLTSSDDDDDVPYNPTTAGGRSRAMVKYLIMKAKYRYALSESALLRDDLESLKREEHRQWKRKEAGVDEIIKSFGSDSDRLAHGGDRQAQQYLPDRDNDSTDWETDMLRELDRERHAFRERERERGRDHDYDRGGYATGIGHDDRGRVRPVDSTRDRDGDIDQMSMNNQSSLPGSRWEDRDSRQGEQRRARSSSRPRYESRLDSRSFHYSPHPYRRTPPSSLPLDHEAHPDPLTHPSASPAPLQPSSRLEEGSTRRREHEQDDMELEYKRYLSPRHQQQRSSGNAREAGRVSPAPQSGRYQSPPPPSHSHQQSQQHSAQPPVASSHSFRESTERSDGSRVQREDPREHAERHGLPYEYKYGLSSSRSPRPPPSPTPHSSSKTMTAAQEESKREQEPDAPHRPSVLEEYERAINTTTTASSSSRAGQNVIGSTQHDRSQQHSSSSSVQSQGQSAVHSYAEHTSSTSPTPPAHRAHAQTRTDETLKSSRTPEEQSLDYPSTSNVPAVPPLSSSHSPHPNSTPNSGSVKSPVVSQPPQSLSSPRKGLTLDPPSATSVPPSSSNVPLSSQPNLPESQGLHPAPAAPTSPSHRSRSNSDAPSAEHVVYHLPETRPKAYHHPPIPRSHHPQYAYAYYPDESEDEEEDEDMVNDSGSLTKGAGVSDNVGSNGSAKREKNTDQDSEIGTTTAVKDAMDVD